MPRLLGDFYLKPTNCINFAVYLKKVKIIKHKEISYEIIEIQV